MNRVESMRSVLRQCVAERGGGKSLSTARLSAVAENKPRGVACEVVKFPVQKVKTYRREEFDAIKLTS